MMKQVILTAAVAAVVAFGVGKFVPVSSVSGVPVAAKESAYERVMRTGVLRCGYYMFKPMSWKDPNGGEMQGMVVDFAKELEQRSGIKMEWVEEVGFTNMFAGLQTGRFDAICTPTWPDARAARVADFGRTWFYSAIVPVVRADEVRFKTVDDINSPEVSIVVHEGDADETLAKVRFPLAKRDGLAQAAANAQSELDVVSRKADVVLTDVNKLVQFEANNPGKLKVLSEEPLQLFPFKIAVQRGDERLNDFLDETVEAMQNGPAMTALIAKFSPVKGAFLPVAKPYDLK